MCVNCVENVTCEWTGVFRLCAAPHEAAQAEQTDASLHCQAGPAGPGENTPPSAEMTESLQRSQHKQLIE